jgi:Purple acid Phosphatase, N-terminal domain
MSDATKHTVTRRGALGLLGAAGAAPLLGSTVAHAAAPSPTLSPSVGSATPVQGLHLTFGPDPARSMVASWITEGSVARPRVLYGTLDGGFGHTVDAETRTYVDGTSGRTV